MANKVFAKKFDKVNKSALKLKDSSNRTKTGQSKAGKIKAHGKIKMG